MKNIILIIIFSTLYCQALITQPSELEIIQNEIKSLRSQVILDELFIKPYIEKKPSNYKTINIIKSLDLKKILMIEPIAAIRINKSQVELAKYWLTPGLKLKSSISLMNMPTSIWMYSWASFYKHSAVYDNFTNPSSYIIAESNDILFNFNPDYSTSFFTRSVEPENGIDFDQSQAGISILSNKFEFIFGKFNTSFGPSSRSNLSLSNNSPPMDQVLLKIKHDKIIFSYVIASLGSNILRKVDFPVDSLYVNQWELFNIPIIGNLLESDRTPVYERFVAHHRLDFKIKDKFRLGVYEQVIFGARNIPMGYMVPILPFWSSQHESGDLDNLMIGIDFDLFISNKDSISNRLYGALLIDEWAPYSTFDKNNRNWFAWQLGYSRNGTIFGKDILIKAEYSRIDGRAYTHRFIINEPKHYGYNLGYWSGTHSDDLLFNLFMMLNANRYIKFGYEYTRFSNNSLEESIIYLEGHYNDNICQSEPVQGACYENDFLATGYDSRGKTSILFSTSLKYHFFLDLEFSSFNTKGLYSSDDFYDITLKLRYNISE